MAANEKLEVGPVGLQCFDDEALLEWARQRDSSGNPTEEACAAFRELQHRSEE